MSVSPVPSTALSELSKLVELIFDLGGPARLKSCTIESVTSLVDAVELEYIERTLSKLKDRGVTSVRVYEGSKNQCIAVLGFV